MRLVCCCLAIAACHQPDSSPADPTAPPVVRDDTITIAEDGRVSVAQLIANDDNVDEVMLGSFGPLHGTVDTDGNYQPDPGFHGVDTFTYVGRTDYYSDYTTTEAKVRVDVTSDGIPYEQATQLSAVGTHALASGDLDGDGRIDLALADSSTDTVAILLNASTGPGDYAATELRFEGGHQPTGIAVGDFDGDGKPDIVTSSAEGIIVLHNITAGGTVAFDAPITVATDPTSGVIAADLDGDGRIDLASVGDGWPDGLLAVRLGQGSAGTIAFGPVATFPVAQNPTQLALVDAGGARGADLAVLTYGGTVSLFVNTTATGDAAASFATRVDRATGDNPQSLVVADLDGDGRVDLGVVDESSDLWIYQNQGPQTFEAARVIGLAGSGPIAAVDLDHQGPIDLVVGADYNATLDALFNVGTADTPFAFDSKPLVAGIATRHLPLDGGPGPSTLQFVDLDGVAPPEIVLSGSDGTYVLFGD